MDQSPCPFCNIKSSRIWAENSLALAFYDGFPVAEGHTLVIPKRHVQSVFGLNEAEQHSVWLLVAEVRKWLAAKYETADFNVGINDGPLAGQTVLHAHVHVIPRRAGDVQDPRGGVRWVLPSKAAYWVEEQR